MIRELPKSHQPQDKPGNNPNYLIVQNGNLIEELFSSRSWQEIVKPLLDEMIASVSGRFTNNRYWHGTLTSNWKGENPLFVAGYQKALMDFNNNLDDFIVARRKLEDSKKLEEKEKSSILYNPFLEDTDAT